MVLNLWPQAPWYAQATRPMNTWTSLKIVMQPYAIHNEYFLYLAPGLHYRDFLQFQKQLTKRVRQSPWEKHLLFCSHPTVLTKGRGQGRPASGKEIIPEAMELIEVKRGGGITIHGQNQLVIYPIRKLNGTFGLNDHLHWIQEFAITIVRKHLDITLEARRSPLGLWKDGYKYASIGIAIDRFITNHGLALNVEPFNIDGNALKLSPCGLPFQTYSCLQNLGPKANVPSLFSFIKEQIDGGHLGPLL